VVELASGGVPGHHPIGNMAFEIVGRERDLASVHAFFGQTRVGPVGLVLEGEAGIGKSTLWHEGVVGARGRGLVVLSSRPAEAERGLAHVGLGDLFDEIVADVAPLISAPRRRVLEITLLREEDSNDPVDHRALGVAVRDVLALLSEGKPTLLAIDDVQWLDASTSRALAFALRRLDTSPLLVLLARRSGDSAELSELEQALGRERVQRLPVGPLSVGALHLLLQHRFDRPFARQTLLRIHERSGGNPFFALELARVLGEQVDPLEPLSVPETLDELVRARLAGLPAATRDALALAAALGTPSESLLERAGVGEDALEPAFAARVIERGNGTVRFSHPLLASVIYGELGGQRHRIHGRLAAIVEDPLLHARHLALSKDAPDADVAAVLDGAAEVACDRGASAVAAELAEQALRLTPPEERVERIRRALAAARAHHAAGEWTRARAIVSDLLAESDLGPLRAETLVLLADLEGLHRAVTPLEEALREAQSQPVLQARIHCRLARAVRFERGFVGGLEHARMALELADRLDDDALRIDALCILAFLGAAVGDPDTPSYATRAHELATAVGDAHLLRDATITHAGLLEREGNLDAARALLERELEAWHERDELAAAEVLAGLSWLELWGGRWQLAADYAARSLEINVQYGLDVPWNHLPIATVAAHRGQLEVARAHSELALRLGKEQIGLHTPVHLAILGLVALQTGDPRTAVNWFAQSEAQTRRLGWRDAGHRWWIPDHVEALLEIGRLDDAVRLLDAWEADAARLRRERVLAHVTRCRGLVASAQGDVDRATSLLEAAVAQHETAGDAFGRARALLALGIVRRRRRQKRATRDAIGAAVEGFEELGAATWSEKARAELGRVGGRTRIEGLTPAESRVAALAAEGRTNKEIAAALFLSERTVETHLTHVYAKLGVRSRAELARAFAAEQSSGGLTISS
jgi:DNA-binding CsgD family transcriptional regulator